MRVVFFGTPTFAAPTLNALIGSNHKVVGVVTQPDRPRGRGQKMSWSPVKCIADDFGIPIFQPQSLKTDQFISSLEGLAPELGVVVAYGRLLPEAVLSVPGFGMLNVHASLLPKYRGAAPIQRAIMAGETMTGVTIIRLVREMDAGPMLKWETERIFPKDTSVSLGERLSVLGSKVLVEAMNDLENGGIKEKPQDHENASFAPRITRDDGLIDWSSRSSLICDQIRSLHPWPHAYSHLNGRRYLFIEGAAIDDVAYDDLPGAHQRGEVLVAQKDSLLIMAGERTAIAVLKIQPEGRRVLTAQAFLTGSRIKSGDIFSSEES